MDSPLIISCAMCALLLVEIPLETYGWHHAEAWLHEVVGKLYLATDAEAYLLHTWYLVEVEPELWLGHKYILGILPSARLTPEVDEAVEVEPALCEVDVPHASDLEVVNLLAAVGVDGAWDKLVHSRQRPRLAKVLGVSRVGETCEPRVVERASLGAKTAIVLEVYREPVYLALLPEVELARNLPICTYDLWAVVHIDKEECATERVGAEHLDGRCCAVATCVVEKLHVLCLDTLDGEDACHHR